MVGKSGVFTKGNLMGGYVSETLGKAALRWRPACGKSKACLPLWQAGKAGRVGRDTGEVEELVMRGDEVDLILCVFSIE